MNTKLTTLAITVSAAALFPLSILAEDAPAKPLTGNGEISYVSTSGNSDTTSLGAGLGLKYKPGPWTTEFTASYVKADSNGETTAEKLSALLAESRSLNDRLDVYARIGYLTNEFAGIDSNVYADAGALYKLLRGDSQFLEVGGGIGYTDENRIGAEDRKFTSANALAKYKWQISKTAEFTDNATLMFDFKDSEDWRGANAAALTASVTSILALKVYNNVMYLNSPVPGFKKTDTTTGVSLVAKF